MEHEQLLVDVFKAYYQARKNKRNTLSQLKFEANLESNLILLVHDIEHKQYNVGRAICFIINKPVKREIFAADFRDRIVHHLLFNYLSPLLERDFIADSYSCRKGYGTLYGINRIAGHIRKCSQNFKRSTYVLKLDISGYFMSIDRKRLLKMLFDMLDKYANRKCKDTNLKYDECLDYSLIKDLLQTIVLNDPTENCTFRSLKKEWHGLPKDKSLFHAKKDCGLPIGNLTSQLFSNVYLSMFDSFMKRHEKCKYYGRYVDDFVIVHNDKQYLCHLIHHIESKLKYFGLILHPKKRYLQHVSKGFEFLGMKQRRGVLVSGKRIKHNINKMLCEYVQAASLSLDYIQVKDFRSRFNSYLGLLRHCSAVRICDDIREKLYSLPAAYLLVDKSLKKVIINKREVPGSFAKLSDC